MEISRQEYWVHCHFLLQGIFPSQRSNPGLLHCKQILYCLSHQGSPEIDPEMANTISIPVDWIELNHMATEQSGKDFPGGPVIKTPRLHYRGTGSVPCLGTKIPYAVQHVKKKSGKCSLTLCLEGKRGILWALRYFYHVVATVVPQPVNLILSFLDFKLSSTFCGSQGKTKLPYQSYLDSIPATQIIKDLSEEPCTSSPPFSGRSFCWSSPLLSWPTSAPNSNLRSNICPFSWANYMPSAPPPLEPGLDSGATKPVVVLRKSECHSSRTTCLHNMRIFLWSEVPMCNVVVSPPGWLVSTLGKWYHSQKLFYWKTLQPSNPRSGWHDQSL